MEVTKKLQTHILQPVFPRYMISINISCNMFLSNIIERFCCSVVWFVFRFQKLEQRPASINNANVSIWTRFFVILSYPFYMVPQVWFSFAFARTVSTGLVGGVVYPWLFLCWIIIVNITWFIVDVNRSSDYVILISNIIIRGGVELGLKLGQPMVLLLSLDILILPCLL